MLKISEKAPFLSALACTGEGYAFVYSHIMPTIWKFRLVYKLCMQDDTVDLEIFVIKIFCRRPFLTKIKHAKYFVQRMLTYTNIGR